MVQFYRQLGQIQFEMFVWFYAQDNFGHEVKKDPKVSLTQKYIWLP
jgi:hypothetical protein